MNIESSRISTIFGEDAQNRAKSIKSAASPLSPNKTKHKSKISNDLNAWEICNPDNTTDKLPQPFRFINKILYKTILGKVNVEIERIEKDKLSHNYEGRVKEITPNTFFDIKGASCICHPTPNPKNYTFVGDRYGNLTILDLNKRTAIVKHPVMPEHRIIDISIASFRYEDTNLLTFSLVFHASKEVHIYRMKENDHKPYHNFTIICARSLQSVTEGCKAGELPFKSNLSPDARYIAVTLYNGNVEVYRVPDPPGIIPNAIADEKLSNNTLKLVNTINVQNINQGSKPSPIVQAATPTRASPLPKDGARPGFPPEVKELKKMRTILCKPPELVKNPEEKLFALLLGEIPQAVLQAKEEEKKIDPKAQKKGPPPKKDEKEQEKAIPAEFFQKEYAKNPDIIVPKIDRAPEFGDISDPLPPPTYYPFVFFRQTCIVLQDTTKKSLAQAKTTNITSHLICAWRFNKLVETYKLETPVKEDVPLYVLNLLFPYKPEKSETSSHANEPPEIHFVQRLLEQRSNSEQKLDITPKMDSAKTLPGQPTQPSGKVADPKTGQAQQAAPKAEDSVDLLPLLNSFTTIYPISMAVINKSLSFLAIGMEDGSMIVWDFLINIEKASLDKHVGMVTHIKFYEDWKIISGSEDGGVNFYDLQDLGKTKKYQNVYREVGNSIVGLDVNEHGIAAIIDSHYNFRIYDLSHFEKLFKVSVGNITGKLINYHISPAIIDCGSGNSEQICIYAERIPKDIDEELSPQNRNGYVLIYRLYENLTVAFPGFGNLMRKGLDKSKAFNAFGNMSMADLRNPNYELPVLGGPPTEAPSTAKGGNKSQASSKNKKGYSKQSSTLSNVSGSLMNLTYRVTPNRGKLLSPKKGELTHQTLHPEKYLVEKPNLPVPELINPIKKTMTDITERNSYKMARDEALQKYSAKLKDELEKQDQYNLLLKRKEMMEKSSLKQTQ